MSSMNDDDDLTVVGDEEWLADLRAQRRSKSVDKSEAAEQLSDEDFTIVGDEEWLGNLRQQRSGGGVASATNDGADAHAVTVQVDDDITIIEGPEHYEVPEVSDAPVVKLPAPPPAPDLPAPVAAKRDREPIAPPPIDAGVARWQPPSRLQAAEEREPASADAKVGQSKERSGLSSRVLALVAAVLLAAVVVAVIVFGGSDAADDDNEQPGVGTTLPVETSE